MSLRRAASRLLPRAIGCWGELQTTSIKAIQSSVLPFVVSDSTPARSMLIRGFNTSFAANSNISQVLTNELEYERQNYIQPEELAAGPPGPFTLTETKGDTLMTLNRTHNNESIEVSVMVNDQPDEEPFEGPDGVLDVDVGVMFNVVVTKKDTAMVFECKSDGSYLEIMHVSIEPAEEEFDDSLYTGPIFEELDEELQKQLHEYLEERGVNADLGAYLLRLVHDKEQREYMYWLERVHKFVE